MPRLSLLLILPLVFFACSDGLQSGYNFELDTAWDGFESINYLQEGGSVLGAGESVEGLLKTFHTFKQGTIGPLFDLAPEDSNIRIVDEQRFNLRRLKSITIEIRFPEDTKVEMMRIFEDYEYSTPGGDNKGDLNETKPVEEEGPFAEVEVTYKRYVMFSDFNVKVLGTRIYNQDSTIDDFVFYDEMRGTRESISKVLTQGSYAGGAGNFTRVVYFKNGQLASDVRSYSKDEDGTITGSLSGNSIDGIVLGGTFEIETNNTPCILDDTGTFEQTIYYPLTHESGKKTEAVTFAIDVNGKYDGTYVLTNMDESVQNKELHKIVTRPSGCEDSLIRRTATVTGTDYEGGSVELSEVTAREFTHIFGVINPLEGSQDRIDFYRVSGVSVLR